MKARHFPLFFAIIACGLVPAGVFAQDKEKPQPDVAKPEKVRFVSIDGVELHGTYYPSSKKKAPVVLMLHALGEDSRKKNWVSLAEELQKAGLNVLGFDFRGHGLSVDVDPDKFWRVEHNFLAAGKAGVGKRTIDVKNFDRRYLPTLVNDIASARAYLERNKNDDGSCNTSSIIVIGAETSAVLGCAWMTSEWFRFKLNPPAVAGLEPTLETRPEGKDIIGAMWLSITPKLADRSVRIDKIIHVPGVKGNTPMVFLYGEEDMPGKKLANACENYLKKMEKNRFTTAFGLKGSKLTGSALLQQSLGTQERMAEYLTELVEAKANEWVERDFRKTSYFWKIPAGAGNPDAIIPVKPAGEINIAYETYDKFIP